MINYQIKPFKKLSTYELYEILSLRNEVFIVEQNCVYQDIDNKDQKAYHVIGYKKDKIVSYSRIFNSGDYFDQASIGRVIVCPKHRGLKYGDSLIQASIDAIESIFQTRTIVISAQLYLKNFYESHGFRVVGEEYLEDNIPHIQMIKS